jgi:hypothetical protein
MTVTFYPRFLSLLDEIERRFPVAEWRGGDLEIWPLARMDLYHDMYWADAGVDAPAERSLPLRIAGRMATPLRNLWSSRYDLANYVARPAPAYAVFLGDGVSLDRVDGRWRDRFGEPLIAALEARGQRTFLMQTGHLGRLPWHRPTFAANLIESRGFLRALRSRLTLDLPEFDRVLEFLARSGVAAPSLRHETLGRRANLVAATAVEFQRLLQLVEPRLAFVVTYHTRLAPAFLLACRRLGILSVDVQRAPHESAPHAYRWAGLPERGYATLPAVFWSWTKHDATRIDEWSGGLAAPWHCAIHGGHSQLASFLDDQDPVTRAWDQRFAAIDRGATFEREILVTLQPLHGFRAVWDALCAQVEASPPSWRWWIRRHPASRPDQDAESAGLLALRLPNVKVAEASALPLPVLMRHANVLVSLASGAAVEASMFGVPALFLIDAARHAFPELIGRGAAAVVEAAALNDAIVRIHTATPRTLPESQVPVEAGLRKIEALARAYPAGRSRPFS